MHVANSPRASQIEICWRQLTVVKIFLCKIFFLLPASTEVSSSINSKLVSERYVEVRESRIVVHQ